MTDSTPKESVSEGKGCGDSCAKVQQSSVKRSQTKSVNKRSDDKNDTPTTDKEAPSTAKAGEWYPIRHPRLPVAIPSRYFVDKYGVVCSNAKGYFNPMNRVKGCVASYRLYISKLKTSRFKLEEIMAYTFAEQQFDRHKHYIFHKDGDQENCAWDNLVVCYSLTTLQELEIGRLEKEHPGTKYTVVRNLRDNLTFERYLVSDTGEVYSLIRQKHMQLTKQDGYLRVMLSSDDDTPHIKSTVSFTVHTIVVRSFIGPKLGNRLINYINGDRCDVSLKNLEYTKLSGVVARAREPEHIKARKLRDEQEDTHKEQDKLRPLQLPNKGTTWRSIGILPWNGRSYSKYQVSDMGHIRKARDHKLYALFLRRGYVCVNLGRDMPAIKRGSSKRVAYPRHTEYVSRIVAHAFVDGYSKTRNFVKHLNGDKQDNRAENLEWVDDKALNRRARLVVASLIDEPYNIKEFGSIAKAERTLLTNSLGKYSAKHNGGPFIKRVNWDGLEEKALIQVFEPEY